MLSKITKNISYRILSLKVPIIDIEPFLKGQENNNEDCIKVADALRDYGCLIIKDPRVKQQQNSAFLDMMQNYFNQRSKQFYDGEQIQDIYPQYDYEVGVTPQYKEKAKTNQDLVQSLTQQNKPSTPFPSPHDSKWRYFWNVGDSKDDYPNQSPKEFPQWQQIMNTWGNHMINGCITVAQMSALGMGFQKNAFIELMINGPHKLAPTGSDLVKFKVGTVFAGFHYDFNFLTIHGKSRYPGLFIWLKTGEKLKVNIPQGYLLLQAGRQFQYLTGGFVTAGYHQVIYTEQVKIAKQKALKQGRIPWRISSTLFSHIRYNQILRPLGKFATKTIMEKYPPIKVKDFVQNEFNEIKRNI